jgi:hypothetical protein
MNDDALIEEFKALERTLLSLRGNLLALIEKLERRRKQ